MNDQTRAMTDCLTNPDSINISTLTDQTMKYQSNGMIDPTENVFNDQVYIYNGMNDTGIIPGHTLLPNLRLSLSSVCFCVKTSIFSIASA